MAVTVTIAPGCFDTEDVQEEPDWDAMDDEEYDARFPAEASDHHDGGWEATPQFRVATDTVELAADALLVAAERFMQVGESGTEHTEPQEDWDEDDRGPSITRVTIDDEAAYISADTDDWLSHRMADTMKFILVQEAHRGRGLGRDLGGLQPGQGRARPAVAPQVALRHFVTSSPALASLPLLLARRGRL